MRKELLTDLTETEARKKLRGNLGKHIECPKCHKKKYVRKMKGKDKRYHCSKCRHKFSLKSLTGFKHSNLDFKQIYYLLHCFGNNKTHKDVIDWLGVSYPTSRLNYSKIRKGLEASLDKGKISGIFACDECFVGKKKTGNQALVMGAVDVLFADVRLEVIPDRDQDSVEGFIFSNIETDSKIISDGWSSYQGIEYMGYAHDTEIHEKGQFKKTVPIERVWGLFKTFLRRNYHHIHKETLPEYLVEFQFKFIHREYRNNPLYIAKILTNPVPNC